MKKLYNKKIMLPNAPHQSSIKCSICNASACFMCVKAVCQRMQDSNLHSNDDWYHHTTNWIHNQAYPDNHFVGHCCELLQKIKKKYSMNAT